MALNYRKCAEEIVGLIGGRDNVAQAAHCATRLRLVIKDNSKVNKEALDEVEGVQGIFESNGQLQLIIGTGTVNKVYDEFLAVTGMTAATKDDVKAAAAASAPLWRRLIKALGDVFVPILPAIVASGLMMGLVEALGKIPGLGFANTDWYQFLDMVSNTAFAYLPVVVAISAARVFGGNVFLGAVIGLCMIHTNLTNGWNTADGYKVWYLFGHIKITSTYTLGQINQLGYQGHVIPVIISVWCMCQIEKFLHKRVPEMFDLFITPLCTVLVTTLITFTVVGPIFSTAETYILAAAKILVRNPIGAMAMGALYPVTVVMGLHHMYNVIEAGMLAVPGQLNTWMPVASAANFAQFGACLAVGLKAAKQKTKVVAVPSSMSAALGITEPAIFGVNMRFFKPFICGMVGGAIGAFFAAISKIGATAYGVTGLPGYLTINNPAVYTIILAISGGIAFVGTWIFWKEDEGTAKKDAEQKEEKLENYVGSPVISCEGGEILAPVKGKVVAKTEIPDDTFAAGVLGETVGIWPDEGVLYAPFDGVISLVADTKHAIGLQSDGGMEAFLHVGVDTVAMNGDGFDALVETGDKVKAGQPILKFSKEKIKAANHPDVVVVILSNAYNYQKVKTNVEA